MQVFNDLFFEQVDCLLKEGKKVFIAAKGISMEPTLQNDDRVLLEAAGQGSVQVGRIVLARAAEGYLLHRVEYMRGEKICLIGDANLWQKEKLCLNDISGVVVAAYRGEIKLDLRDGSGKIEQIKRKLSRLWKRGKKRIRNFYKEKGRK